jgi:predicted dehydrogenase
MGNMKPVRWAFWGCGAMARSFAIDLLATRGSVLASVASRTPERAQRFANDFGGATVRANLAALIEDADVDVVYVSTPPATHLDDSLAVLSAGKGLLCEKPLAMDARQAEQIADAARRSGVFCMEAMWMRFVPVIQAARQLVSEGAIGAPQFMTANFSYQEAGERLRYLCDPAKGAGSLLDRGVYPLHLALAVLGPASVAGASFRKSHGGMDAQASFILQHASGAQSQLVSSFLATGTNDAIISGDAGLIHIRAPFYKAERLMLYPRKAAGAGSQGGKSSTSRKPVNAVVRRIGRHIRPFVDSLRSRTISKPFPGSGYQFEIGEVASCIREGRTQSNVVPLQESVEVMRLVDGIRSASGGDSK